MSAALLCLALILHGPAHSPAQTRPGASPRTPAGQSPQTQAIPRPQSAQPAPQAAPQAQPRMPEEAASADYQIGPQDILRVTVYGHEDLTQTVLVQPDGTFTFPLIGRVKASDNTPAELEKKIVTLLAKGFIRNPQVTVVVQEFRSKTVYVVGEVQRPGPYPLAGHTMLVEVLAKAGPTPNAGAEVVIVRPPKGSAVNGPILPTEVVGTDGGGKTAAGGGAAAMPATASSTAASGAPSSPQAQVFRVAVGQIQEGHLDQNIALEPNDTVFVPQAPKVFVTGEVRNAGAYGWFPGLTARQLISLAGGLTPDGSDGRLKVVRQVNGQSKEQGIKLDAAIQPGDTLVVRRRLF
jgi:polysaccharide export outer membrane protein